MQRRMLPENIATQLRRDILRGKLPPGSSLKERETAADMGVSRTPMREAIRILAKEGLIDLRPSRSPLVANPDIKEITEQAVVLIALEKLSAELACIHATEADFERVQNISDHMSAHYESTDPLDMFEIDMSFHTAIAAASHNRSLAATHSAYLARLWRARYLSAVRRRNRERLVTQHEEIVQALRARDAKKILAAIDTHLWKLSDDIKAAMYEPATESN